MGEFTTSRINKLLENLNSQKIIKSIGIDNIAFKKCDYKTTNELTNNNMEKFNNGDRVYGFDGHFWFHFEFTAENLGQNSVPYLQIISARKGNVDAVNPQGIVYLNGKIVQGTDINHTTVPIKSNEKYDCYFYLYVGMINIDISLNFSLVYIDFRIEKLYYDIFVLSEAYKTYDKYSENYSLVTSILEDTANILDFRAVYSDDYFYFIKKADEFLAQKVYFNKNDNRPIVHAIGHTHIDVAWLWTFRQTREKVQRSFSNVLSLMKSYDDFNFMSSQPQLFEYLKEDSPELYSEVKKRVSEGRFEIEGGMWLEADCNLISGESIVRQLLFGKRFIKKEFNKESHILWLPDVFGYSAVLPQILKKSGITDFITSKISWNDTNTMPYDTFMWRGIDGSEILTNFLTAQWLPSDGVPKRTTSYVGKMSPQMVLGAYKRYQQKEINSNTVITYGFGDGGGGPTKDMLEYQKRLSYGIFGIPKTKISSAREWLNSVHKSIEKNKNKIPLWSGELYLELHRGTYTSMAKNKKNNRRAEFALQKAELLSSTLYALEKSQYQNQEINNIWKKVLLCQFHDVLPGSSIKEVYNDTDKIYSDVFLKTKNIINNKLDYIKNNVSAQNGLLIYNSCGFDATGAIRINDKTYEILSPINANGWNVIDYKPHKSSVLVKELSLENNYYLIKFDKSGRIYSLFDKKADRELVQKGSYCNELQVFEDIPRDFDAWEISNYYNQKMWIVNNSKEVKIIDDGDRLGIEFTNEYMSSTIKQTIYLYNTLNQIDFETFIDWKESHQLLKTAFPLEINANRATYEIQYGYVERPTTKNNSWDSAKFEVCAHKWADISEYGYGVSLLNDCKYGYSCENSTLKLTLLKSATYPNPDADKEKHYFTYSLVPHIGDLFSANVIKKAYLLNQPLEYKEVNNKDGFLSPDFSLFKVTSNNVIIDTIKKAEDLNAIIIRMYESFGGKTVTALDFGFFASEIYECDLMENDIKKIDKKDNCINLKFTPFEIKTLKFYL